MPLGGQNLKYARMDPDDDPEAFLLAFEQVARKSLWPREQWTMHLAPLLSGKLLEIYRALPGDSSSYDQVKYAILEYLGVNEESCRKKFRSFSFTADTKPREIVNQLQEWCRRWLRPEIRNPGEIVEMVIMEQLVHIMPAGARQRLRHQPVWSLDILVKTVEDFFVGNHKNIGSTACDGHVEVMETVRDEEIVTVAPEITSILKEFDSPIVWDHQDTKDIRGVEKLERFSTDVLQFTLAKVKIQEDVEIFKVEPHESVAEVKILEEEKRSAVDPKTAVCKHNVQKEMERSPVDFHVSMAEDEMVEEVIQSSLERRDLSEVHTDSIVKMKIQEGEQTSVVPQDYVVEVTIQADEQPTVDLQDSLVEMAIQNDKPPTVDLQDSLVEVLIQDEEKSIVDHQDSVDRVRIEQEESLSVWDLQDSVVEVKTLDVYDTIEEWDKPTTSDENSSGEDSIAMSLAVNRTVSKAKKKPNAPGKVGSRSTLSRKEVEESLQQQSPSRSGTLLLGSVNPAGSGRSPRSCDNGTISERPPVSQLLLRMPKGDKPCERKMNFLPQLSVEIHQETGIGEQLHPDFLIRHTLGDTAAFAMQEVMTHFMCIECGEIFIDELNLNEHQQEHEKKKLCAHSDCGSIGTHVSSMTVQDSNPLEEPLYTCKECGQEFKTLYLLTAHQLIHAAPAPFLCSDCGKSFRDPSSFFIHQKTHPVRKPYACPECGISFCTRSYLNLHLKKHKDKPKDYFKNLIQLRSERTNCSKKD